MAVFKPSKLRAYLLHAQEFGFSPEALLDGGGIAWSAIEGLEPLDLDTTADLFELVARRTPADFAVRCGSLSKVRDFGIVGYAMMSMPTLRAAFAHWNRYCLVAGHPLVTTISEDGEVWRMHFAPRRLMSREAERFCVEASVAAMSPIIEELTNLPATSVSIAFSFPRPTSLTQYHSLGTKALEFGAPQTIYCGARADLNRPISAADTQVRDIFQRQCAEFLADLTQTRSLSERLEDLMEASAGSLPSLDGLAAALGLSRRSLQRELRTEGVSYQQIVRDYRVKHAKLLLSEGRANAKTIAHMLGFQDTGSFRRAFHEWTGQSITTFQSHGTPDAARPRPHPFGHAAEMSVHAA